MKPSNKMKIIFFMFLLPYLFLAERNALCQEKWKTYSNSKYYFSIKYPEDWTIDETLASSLSGGVKLLKGIIYDGRFIESDGAEIYISYQINNEKFTLENWKNYIKRTTDVEEDLNISGNKAIKLTGQVLIPTETPSPIENSKEVRIFLIRDNIRFELIGRTIGQNFKEYSNVINKVFSTFEFTK